MTDPSKAPVVSRRLLALLVVLFLVPSVGSPASASAAKRCFGKKVDRVVRQGKRHNRLKAGDVIWMLPGTTVRTRANSRICADRGSQTIQAGKGRSWVSTGAGDDVIRLDESSNRNLVDGGAGNDRLFGSKGHDTLTGGPGNDLIRGGGGNDEITDLSGDRNLLFGEDGSDRISSLGSAVSELHGGNGSDFMYSNGGLNSAGAMEKLFGEKGNDRLLADRPDNRGPAYLDGGEGDDWMYGTPEGDVAIFNSGIKKIHMGDGDDLMVASGRGATTVDGGAGIDTISYEALMPSTNPFRRLNGIRVRLVAGVSQGYSRYALSGIENVIGSAFNDELSGVPGQHNEIHGGLGDDMLTGDDSPFQGEPPYTSFFEDDGSDNDIADGGLGTNGCFFFSVKTRCGDESPGRPPNSQVTVSIEKGGILTVLGSPSADTITIGYDKAAGQYRVDAPAGTIPAGLCAGSNSGATTVMCPADVNRLNGMFVYGGIGDDRIELDLTIPDTLTTTLDGGPGKNFIQGGSSKDFIATDGVNDPDSQVFGAGSAGSDLHGGGNLDVIYANDAVTVDGGPGPDGLRVVDPCVGATLNGGDDADSIVFAGARRGVEANLAAGYAKWNVGDCAARTQVAGDVEKLEGTAFEDTLILGKRQPGQQGKSTLLGREGVNTLDARNGDKNTITTGPEARKNIVRADPEDKVVWGWGLAAF